jgi:hypothetical protein
MNIATSVETALDTFLSRLNEEEDRDYSYLHPSELGGCPRQTFYKTTGIKPMVPPPPQSLRIFSNGHFVHLRYQMYLRDAGILAKEKVTAVDRGTFTLGLTDLEKVVVDGKTGRRYHYSPGELVWVCGDPEGDVIDVGGMVVPKVKPACDLSPGDEVWMVEVPLFDPEYHIGGHADAIVKTPAGAAVVDFKSTNENSFGYLFHDKGRMDEYHLSYPDRHFQICHICGEEISRWKDYVPHLIECHMNHISVDEKHEVQLNVYMWLLGLENGLLLHENKNTQAMLCVTVDRDETLVSKIKSDAVDVWRLIEAGGPPPERPYKSRSKFPCAWCDFVSHCWA